MLDELHIERSLAHLHPKFIDHLAILIYRMAVASRQAATYHHAVTAHSDS